MLTKYLNGTNYALVAGYNEIGETLEDTVKREVLEEVGLRVCNIKYYKSQPWGKTESCLSGFYADVYEDGPIKVEEDELKFANWFSPEEIDIDDDHISLTREMILSEVWDSDYFGSDRVVDDSIRRLRKKMPNLNINTVYGFGYRLN
jgi:NAD+ diphosphatase